MTQLAPKVIRNLSSLGKDTHKNFFHPVQINVVRQESLTLRLDGDGELKGICQSQVIAGA